MTKEKDRVVLTLVLCLCFVVAPSQRSADAQLTPAENQEFEASTMVRYESRVTVDPDRPDLVLRLVEEQVRRRAVHHLEVFVDGSTQTLCRIPIQREFVARYYGHRTEVAELGPNHYALLLETHVPDASLAPPDPVRHQLAMHLQPDRRSRWTCRLVARGEFTRLDGGRQLRLDRESEPPALVRSDTTEGTRFCGLRELDGQSYEVFDPREGRFVPRTHVEVIKDKATKLPALLPPRAFQDPYLTAVYSWAWATSDYRGTPSGAVALRPLALGDLDLSTAWIEGGHALGQEEYVTASVNDVVYLRGFRIFPGHGASAASHKAYARPTRILVSLSDGTRYEIDLGDADYDELRETRGLTVDFPEPVRTNCMSVMILESRPGERRGRNAPVDVHRSAAIAEITPFSEYHGESAAETAQRIVEAIAVEPSNQRRERLYQMTGKLGEHLVAAIEIVLREGSTEQRQRVIPLLGRMGPDLAIGLLVEAFTTIDVDAPEYRVLQRTLAAHGAASAERLLPLLDHLDMEEKKYVDTIRLIGRIGTPNDVEALLPGLGQGNDFVRNERVRAVAHGRRGIVDDLVVIVHTSPDSPAAYDALKALTTIGRRLYLDQGAQVEDVRGLVPAIEANTLRRHILRGIEAMGYYAIPEGIGRLQERYLEGSPDPLVRQAAAQTLEYYPGAEAREALEAALGDASPDVRIAAIGALANRPDSSRSLDEVLGYAARERWPQALNHAYTILAEVETQETTAFFQALLRQERDTQLAIVATRALKRAERALPVPFLESLFADGATPIGLRRQLIDLLGYDETDEGEALLVEIIRRRGASHGARHAERADILDRHAIMAAGMRRSEKGKTLLLQILESDDDIERRQHAARALGFYADAELVTALRELESRLEEPLQQRVGEAITMIENRLAIEDAQLEIQDAIDSMDQ